MIIAMSQPWRHPEKGVFYFRSRLPALAGEWYGDLVTTHQDDPGDPDDWAIYQDLLGDGLECFQVEDNPKQGVRVLSRQFDIDAFLEGRRLNLDEPTRTKLVEQVAIALIQGAETLKRRGRGDYGPDETAKRFPTWRAQRTPVAAGRVSLTTLLEGWAKKTRPAQSTLDLRKTYVAVFAAYIGRDDARSVQRPDIVRWKNHLVELGNATKTINDGKLAALKAIFRWGVDNELLASNPAAGVSVKRSRKSGEKMLGFEKDEAATILRAASKATNPIHRWVPLLCAQSGAPVSEVCQLRKEDIVSEDGIAYMHFRAEAGGLKNPSSERKVPLHPYVIEAGFTDFVDHCAQGPLFYEAKRRHPGAKKPQPKIVAKSVARWVHTLGISVGRRFRKDPNHAWRHLFRTLARDASIEESVVNAIQGHAAATVGQSYGETLLRTAQRAIERIPLPGVSMQRSARPDPLAMRGLGEHEPTSIASPVVQSQRWAHR